MYFSPNYVLAFVYCGTELIPELTENFQQLCIFSGGFHSLVFMMLSIAHVIIGHLYFFNLEKISL